MSCPVNTLLSQGKAFEALSEGDQWIALTQLIAAFNATLNATQKEFQALSERDQMLVIAILFAEISTNGESTPNPVTLLANGADFQKLSQGDGLTVLEQECCSVPG